MFTIEHLINVFLFFFNPQVQSYDFYALEGFTIKNVFIYLELLVLSYGKTYVCRVFTTKNLVFCFFTRFAQKSDHNSGYLPLADLI